jgi:hypothetical protein
LYEDFVETEGIEVIERDKCALVGRGWQGLERGGTGRRFDSHQFNDTFSFSFLSFIIFSKIHQA